MSIIIRKRRLKHGKAGLYLDIYYKGQRTSETLGLHLTSDKGHNKEVLKLAKKISTQRELDIQSGKYGFPAGKRNINIFEFARPIYKHNAPNSTCIYESMLKHLATFSNKSLTFEPITPQFCERFKSYLTDIVSPNTAVMYFLKFRTILNRAIDQNILHSNPTQKIRIKGVDVLPKFLTTNDVQKLMITECKNPHVKNAFLFSVFTGLRLGDVQNLKWEQITDSSMKVIEKKTQSANIQPLAKITLKILEEQKAEEQKYVFRLGTKQSIGQMLAKWGKTAGLERRLSFHQARHTFATLLITKGIDLYVVSKLLGHKNISTTQIYAKVIDSKKVEAIATLPESL